MPTLPRFVLNTLIAISYALFTTAVFSFLFFLACAYANVKPNIDELDHMNVLILSITVCVTAYKNKIFYIQK